jgi:type III secretory pathway component EscS
MEDRFVKYSKLYFLVFLLFLSIPVIIAVIFGLLYGFAKLVSSRPGDMVFELLVISIPPAIFSAAYYIFSKRTKTHPSAVVRIISQILFVLGIGCSMTVLVFTIIAFFKARHHNITDYTSYTLAFMAGNIALLFLIAIMQAFTSRKEKDWMEKRKEMGKN